MTEIIYEDFLRKGETIKLPKTLKVNSLCKVTLTVEYIKEKKGLKELRAIFKAGNTYINTRSKRKYLCKKVVNKDGDFYVLLNSIKKIKFAKITTGNHTIGLYSGSLQNFKLLKTKS